MRFREESTFICIDIFFEKSFSKDKDFFINSNFWCLHELLFYPISIFPKDSRKFFVLIFKQDHECVETAKQSEWWFTHPDDTRECPVTRELGLFFHIEVSMTAEVSVGADHKDDGHLYYQHVFILHKGHLVCIE